MTAREHTGRNDPVLRVRNLRVGFGAEPLASPVVRGIELTLSPGECLAIVGESGSGKSVTARSLLGLTGAGSTVRADVLEINGKSLLGASDRRWRAVRGRNIALVSQDALVALDPLRPIGREIGDALRLHTRMGASARRNRVLELLEAVGMPEPALRAGQRSGELSGGQRQRALIAAGIALDPSVLVADEPTTALDVTVQAQVLELLGTLKNDGMAILLISHDLAVVSAIADRIAVMDDGLIVEEGAAAAVLQRPAAPQTRRLIAAVPFGRPRFARLGPAPVEAAGTSAASVSEVTDPRPAERRERTPLLELRHVSKAFSLPGGRMLTAVDDVSLELVPGRTLGLVGESGSGKSTTARLALALAAPDSGDVLLDGSPWSALRERERRPLRPKLAAIYQDALSSFDPRRTVSDILADASAAPGARVRRNSDEVRRLLDLVRLPFDVAGARPVHLSGGQRQRVSIARALAAHPQVLICDEPVSALDVSVQAAVLDLLDDLQQQLGLALLFISHDLGVIQHMSDTLAVMLDGRIVEHGDTQRIFAAPEHPYTRRLLAAAPRLAT